MEDFHHVSLMSEDEKPWKRDLVRTAANRREQVAAQLETDIQAAPSFEEALRLAVDSLKKKFARYTAVSAYVADGEDLAWAAEEGGYLYGDFIERIAEMALGRGKAARKNAVRDRSTAFWSLPLAAETRAYVPRLLALALIIKNPSKYGIVLPTISDKPYFEQVDVGSSIKLNQAARLADMSLAELKQLNPGYTRNATDPTGHHKLILPIERIALFKERLMNERSGTTQLASADEDDVRSARVDDADEEVSTTQFTHTIKRGDTLGSIAKRHSVSVDDLKRWNRSKTNKKLKLGTKLIIVKAETEAAPTVSRSRVAKNNQSDSRKAEQARELAARQTTSHKRQIAKASTTTHYTVRSGDSLVKIATRHGMKTTELKRMNNLSSNALKPGQRLVVSS
jgi:membrane-bound lytic murein transglycosylase D